MVYKGGRRGPSDGETVFDNIRSDSGPCAENTGLGNLDAGQVEQGGSGKNPQCEKIRR